MSAGPKVLPVMIAPPTGIGVPGHAARAGRATEADEQARRGGDERVVRDRGARSPGGRTPVPLAMVIWLSAANRLPSMVNVAIEEVWVSVSYSQSLR